MMQPKSVRVCGPMTLVVLTLWSHQLTSHVTESVLIDDYLAAVASSFGGTVGANAVLQACPCLLELVANGTCPLCNSFGCANILGNLTACSQWCAGGTQCTTLLNFASSSGSCTDAKVLPYFPVGEAICKAQDATLNLLFDSLDVDDTLRSQCASLNVTSCQSVCNATSCSSHLSRLVECSKSSSAHVNCTIGLSKLSSAVDDNMLTCRSFTANRVCESYHAGAASPYQNFNEIFPYSLSFVLPPSVISACSCFQKNLTNCAYCTQVRTTCAAISTFRDCSDKSTNCTSTQSGAPSNQCSGYLTAIEALLASPVCDDNNNCTSAFPNGLFSCTTLHNTTTGATGCEKDIALVQAAAPVPLFYALPTSSPSSSISLSSSVTKSRSRSPSISRTPSASKVPGSASSVSGVWLTSVVALVVAVFVVWM